MRTKRDIVLAVGLGLGLGLGFGFGFGGQAFAEGPSDGGTQVTVQVTDGGETTVEVHRGVARVRAAGEVTRVKAGQGVHVRRGQRARRVSLLHAPADLTPKDGARAKTVEVALTWGAVPGANGYRVQVSPDASFAHPLEDATTTEPKTRLKLRAGTFYWKVQALDHDGLPGRASAACRLTIDAKPPRLKAGKPTWQ